MSSVRIQVINPNTSLAMTETIGALRVRSLRRAPRSLRSVPAPGCRQLRATLTKPSRRSACWSRSGPDASREWMGM